MTDHWLTWEWDSCLLLPSLRLDIWLKDRQVDRQPLNSTVLWHDPFSCSCLDGRTVRQEYLEQCCFAYHVYASFFLCLGLFCVLVAALWQALQFALLRTSKWRLFFFFPPVNCTGFFCCCLFGFFLFLYLHLHLQSFTAQPVRWLERWDIHNTC